MPKVLDGSNLYQLSWRDNGNSSISVTCKRECVVTVAAWEHEKRLDSIASLNQADGWIFLKGKHLKWEKKTSRDQSISGYTKFLFLKKLRANQTISFIKHEHGLPISVFVDQGRLIF